MTDDGIGFDAADDEERAGHYGLIGLRERVRQAGGTLEIKAARPGKGASLTVRIPIPRIYASPAPNASKKSPGPAAQFPHRGFD